MDTLAKLLPAKYAPWLLAIPIIVPWIGRGATALKNGGGLVGVYRSIVYGSTTVHFNDPPKPTPPPKPVVTPATPTLSSALLKK